MRSDTPLAAIETEILRPAVLVVEDEVLIRLGIAHALRDAGYTVIEANNAHEALELIAVVRGIGAVFTDIRMPGSIDGIGLARHILSEHPDMKVILTSGHLSVLDWAGHHGYFVKPYEYMRVIQHIAYLLRSDSGSRDTALKCN